MQEGRTKKVAVNVVYNFLNQFLTLVLTFLSRTVFIYVFGAKYLGLNGLFSDVLGLLSLAELGFSTAMLYNLYLPLAEADYKRISALMTFYKKVYQMIAGVVLILGLVILPFLRLLVDLEKEIPNLEWYYLFSLANVVCSYSCAHKTALLTADQKNYVVAKISMATNSVKIILQMVAAVLWRNYTIYLVIGTAGVLVNSLLILRVATKQYAYLTCVEKVSREEKKEILKNFSSVFIYKISSVLLTATDNILISTLVGTIVVGYYSNYLMVQSQLVTFYSLVFTSATASIGNLIVKESARRRYEVFESEQAISFILCGIVVPCYVSLINDFIRLWVGESYVLSLGIVCAIGANLYLSCVLQPLWSYREATGLYQKTKWVMLVCAVLNLVLSVLLGLWIGVAGIILASALSRLLTYVWYEPKILYQEYFQKKAVGYYGKIMVNAAITIGITWFGTVLSIRYPALTFFSFLGKACCYFIASVVLMFCIYGRSRGMQYIWRKVKGMMYR